MRVTIITVCRNAEGTIEATLRSVAEQDHPDIEHIVIDGDSWDGTEDVVRRHGQRVARFVSETDGGIYDAMNKGIRSASGDCTCFLNADDFYASRSVVSALVSALDSTMAGAAHADLRYVDRGDTSREIRRWKGCGFEPGAFARGWAPAHPTFVARTELLREMGGFDTRYRLAADFDLMLRMLEVRRVPSTYLPLDAVRMRVGGATSGSLRSIVRQNLEILDSLRRHGLAPSGAVFMARKLSARLRQRADAVLAGRNR